MTWWIRVAPSVMLVAITIALQALEANWRRVCRQSGSAQWFLEIQTVNHNRRWCISLGVVIVVMSILITPWPINRTWWWTILNIAITAGVIRYWYHQPRTVTDYQLNKRPN